MTFPQIGPVNNDGNNNNWVSNIPNSSKSEVEQEPNQNIESSPSNAVPLHTPPDNHQLAIDAGDAFIADSLLEGSSPNQNLSRLLDALNVFPFEGQTKLNKELSDLFSQGKKIADQLQLIQHKIMTENEAINVKNAISEKKEDDVFTNYEEIERLANSIKEQVQTLQVGHKILIPSGWSKYQRKSTDAGHAIMLTIERQINDQYQLTVFNTGAGLSEYHPEFIDKNGDKRYQTFLQIRNIEPENLNSLFFMSLLELQTAPLWDSDMVVKPSDLYDDVLGLLKGQGVQPLDPYRFGAFFMKPQRAGTCALKSLFAVLRYYSLETGKESKELTEKYLIEYKKFRFNYKRQSLKQTCESYFDQSEPFNRTTHKLISDISRSLSRTVKKLLNNKSISERESQEILAEIKSIRSGLREKKVHQSKKTETVKLPFTVENHGCKDLSSNYFDHLIADYRSIQNNEKHLLVPLKAPSIPFGPNNKVKWTVENVVNYLNEWNKLNQELISERPLEVYETAIQALRELPAPDIKDHTNIWNNIPLDQIEACLTGLFNISKIFLGKANEGFEPLDKPKWAISNQSLWHTPGSILGTYTALAIADFLAKRDPNNQLKGFKVPYHDLLTFAYDGETVLQNPKDQIRLNQLLEYFEPGLDHCLSLKEEKDRPHQYLFCLRTSTEPNTFNEIDILPYKYFDEGCVDRDQEAKYYSQFLKDQNIIQALKEAGLSNKPLEDKITYLALTMRLENPLIPKSAIYLKNIAIASQIIVPRNLKPTSDQKNIPHFCYIQDPNFEFRLHPKGIMGDYKEKTYEKQPRISEWIFDLGVSNINTTPQKVQNKKSEQKAFSEIGNTLFGKGWNYEFDDYDVKKISKVRTYNSTIYPSLNPPAEAPPKNRYQLSQNKLIVDYPFEDPRDKYTMAINVHDQIVRALSYLENQPDILENPQEALSFTLNFLWPERLLPQIEQEPRVAVKMLEILNRHFDEAAVYHKWKKLLYIALICNQAAEYFSYARSLNPENFKDIPKDFPFDYRQWILDKVLPQCEDEKVRKVFCELLLTFCASRKLNHPKNIMGEEIAEDWLVYTLMSDVENDKDFKLNLPVLENDRKLTVAYYLPIILQTLSEKKDFRDRVLNKVARRITGLEVNSSWQGEYPVYKSDKFCINILDRTISGEGIFESLIPLFIRRDSKLQDILSNITKFEFISKNCFAVHDDNGITNIEVFKGKVRRKSNDINTDNKPEYVITRNIGGLDYRLVSLDRIIQKQSENRSVEELYLPFDEKAICWMSDAPPRYYVQTPEGKNYYCDYIKSDNDAITITSIKDADDPDRVLINPSIYPEFERLLNISSKKLVLWGKIQSNKEIEVVEIQMPTLRMNFYADKDSKGQKHFFSKEECGFFISEDQLTEMNGLWHPYIVLENSSKQRKVVMLALNLLGTRKDEVVPKRRKGDFDTKIDINYIDRNRTITCTIEQEQGKNNLKPSTIVDALQLFGILLSTKRYRQALDLLDQCRTLRAYSKEECKLFKYIIEGKYGGSHPSAIVCRLKLALLFLENEKYEKDSSSKLTDQTNDDLVDYLNNLSNFTTEKLNINEVKELIKKQAYKNSVLSKRLDDIYHSDPNQRVEYYFYPNYNPPASQNDDDEYEIPEPSGKTIRAESYSLDFCEDEIHRILFKDKQVGDYQKPKSIEKYLFSKERLNKNYRHYYEIALMGTEEERKELEKYLLELQNIHTGNEDWKNTIIMTYFLLYMLENPYPYSNKGERYVLDNYWSNTIRFGLKEYNGVRKYRNKLKLHPTPPIRIDNQRRFTTNTEQLSNELPKIQNKKIVIDMKLDGSLCVIDKDWDKAFQDAKKENKTKKDLESWLEQEVEKQKDQEHQLLEFANSISSHATTLESLDHQGLSKPKIAFRDLIALFEKGSSELYKQKTYLSDDQINVLDQKIAEYLSRNTQISKINRILGLMAQLENSAPEDREFLSKLVSDEYDRIRQYSFGENEIGTAKRRFLIMEFRSQIFLREKQVRTLNIIYDHTSSDFLLELGTGSGKSKVLAPMMERQRDEGKAVLNVWPHSLYETNREDMQKLVGQTFGQKATTFEFTRTTPITLAYLKIVLQDLVTAVMENRQINTTPESLQSFELKFIELMNNCLTSKDMKNAPIQSIKIMQAILNIMDEGEFHIDEAHINLSPRREVNFTLGSPSAEPSERIEFVEQIFRFLTVEKGVGKELGIREDKQRFAAKQFPQIFQRMVDHFVDPLRITKEQMESYRSYVLGGDVPPWFYLHEKKELIVLLREHLTVLLPSILEKSVNVNFGLTHKKKQEISEKPSSKKQKGKVEIPVEYAIPYHGNDTPIENARYEHVYEALDKTYLTYLYQGLKEENLLDIIQLFQKEALKQSKLDQIPTKDTAAYKKYEEIFQGCFEDLFSINRDVIKKNYEKIKKLPLAALFYVTTFVAPKITKYKEKLKSTPQDLLNMTQCNLAMTATPGDPTIYRSDEGFIAKFKPDIGSERSILDKIVGDNPGIYVVEDSTPDKIFQDALTHLKGDFRMLIDIGALFKGISNREIANQLLDHFTKTKQDIEGIVFFDDNNQMVILEKGKEPIPATNSSLDIKKRFTYCDQRHAFGTDTVQFHKAKGLATFDTLTTKDEVLQGVGRMRQFMSGQKVDWLLTTKTKEKIKFVEPLKITDLLEHAKINQSTIQRENMIRSIRQQMNGEVRKVLMHNLFKSTPETALKMFTEFKPFLIEKVPESLDIPTEQASNKIDQIKSAPDMNPLDRQLISLSDQIKDLKELDEKEKSQLQSTLNSYKKRIQDLLVQISKEVDEHQQKAEFRADQRGVGTEVEVQVESETNVKAHNEQENELESQSESYDNAVVRNPFYWPNDHFSFFDNEWLQPIKSEGAQETKSKQVTTYKNVPLHNMEDILTETKDLTISGAHSILSTNDKGKVLMTNNFVQKVLLSNTSGGCDPQEPLTIEQKSAYEVLIIQDIVKDKTNWTIVVGDQGTDAYFWRNKLKYLQKQDIKGDRRVCLYDLSLKTIVADSPKHFSNEELQNDRDLQALLTRVKLYNGDVDYTPMQRNEIEAMADTPQKRKDLKAFFIKAIMHHDEKHKLWKDSWIRSFFNKDEKK